MRGGTTSNAVMPKQKCSVFKNLTVKVSPYRFCVPPLISHGPRGRDSFPQGKPAASQKLKTSGIITHFRVDPGVFLVGTEKIKKEL
mgnify:CR=1 FL=1